LITLSGKGGLMKNNEVTRREFIKGVGTAALATAVVSPFLGLEAQASSGKAPLPMKPIMLDITTSAYNALAAIGGSVKITNPHDAHRPIIVIRSSQSTVMAYSSKCTHFGCELNLPVNNVIACPCHGSKFDIYGKVLKGPAGKSLMAFSAVLDGSTVTITDLT
jgi:cytochrome b6-f complex iron-sulfur subunit